MQGPTMTRNILGNNHVTIALMGGTGTGKSTFVNLASGSNLRIGNGLKSCTSAVEPSKPFVLDGIQVTLIDTPGFGDTVVSDTEILSRIGAYLATMFEQGHVLGGVIYLHRISDVRMSGSSRRNFQMFQKICGDHALSNAMIVTNMWEDVPKEVGEAREYELANDNLLFKPAISKGARMMRHVESSADSAQHILRCMIRNYPKALRIQAELIVERKDIADTEACQELDREMADLKRRQIEELQKIKMQLGEARLHDDLDSQEELEKAHQSIMDSAATLEHSRKNLSIGYAEQRKEVAARRREGGAQYTKYQGVNTIEERQGYQGSLQPNAYPARPKRRPKKVKDPRNIADRPTFFSPGSGMTPRQQPETSQNGGVPKQHHFNQILEQADQVERIASWTMQEQRFAERRVEEMSNKGALTTGNSSIHDFGDAVEAEWRTRRAQEKAELDRRREEYKRIKRMDREQEDKLFRLTVERAQNQIREEYSRDIAALQTEILQLQKELDNRSIRTESMEGQHLWKVLKERRGNILRRAAGAMVCGNGKYAD